MTTAISRIYLSTEELRSRESRRTLTGFALGFALALVLLAAGALWHYSKAEPTIEPAVERGCRLPQIEGAWTIFGVVDGRLRCWRFQ